MHLRGSLRKIAWIGLAVALLDLAGSCILFRVNGGFGGGHGDYDSTIFLLSLPWSLVIGAISDSLPVHLNDEAVFVMLPAALNLSVIGSIWLYASRGRRKP
jgi:hypothetical protein